MLNLKIVSTICRIFTWPIEAFHRKMRMQKKLVFRSHLKVL